MCDDIRPGDPGYAQCLGLLAGLRLLGWHRQAIAFFGFLRLGLPDGDWSVYGDLLDPEVIAWTSEYSGIPEEVLREVFSRWIKDCE